MYGMIEDTREAPEGDYIICDNCGEQWSADESGICEWCGYAESEPVVWEPAQQEFEYDW